MSHQDDDASKGLPPRQTQIKRILRWGSEHSAITQSIPNIDVSHWSLTIDGEVETPLHLDWDTFLKYPVITSVSDFHCVEGWSVLGCQWTGVAFKQIIHEVHPTQQARFVSFRCIDGYMTSLSLEDLLKEDVVLAVQLNGEVLPPELGGPVRLIVPHKYSYKSAMWLKKITFTVKAERGYWERRGFSQSADIWTNDRFSNLRVRVI